MSADSEKPNIMGRGGGGIWMKYCPVAKTVGWDRPICVKVNGRRAACALRPFRSILVAVFLTSRWAEGCANDEFFTSFRATFLVHACFLSPVDTRGVYQSTKQAVFLKEKKRTKKERKLSGADMSRLRKFLPKKKKKTVYVAQMHVCIIIRLALFTIEIRTSLWLWFWLVLSSAASIFSWSRRRQRGGCCHVAEQTARGDPNSPVTRRSSAQLASPRCPQPVRIRQWWQWQQSAVRRPARSGLKPKCIERVCLSRAREREHPPEEFHGEPGPGCIGWDMQWCSKNISQIQVSHSYETYIFPEHLYFPLLYFHCKIFQ